MTMALKVMTKESLLAAQKEELLQVMEVLSVKEHHARTMLIHYRWDTDKLFTEFVENGAEQLFAQAGVPLPMLPDIENHSISSKTILCEICHEEFPANETTPMECGHCFCNECWTEQSIIKIDEGQGRRITCMAYECYSICDEEKIRNLLSARDSQLAEKFDRFLLESYINDNKMVIKWCPSVPHCGNAVCVKRDVNREVECACGLQFCFVCTSVAHSPCSCLMWEHWVRKCKDEIKKLRCIKKTDGEGCNLVRCCGCGQFVCWLCGAVTGSKHTGNNIANYACGHYKEENAEEAENVSKATMWYTHYYIPYRSDLRSLKADESMKTKMLEKVATLESQDKDCQWVRNGYYILVEARRILLCSYPFAYFVFDDELFKNGMSSEESIVRKNLFENQQEQLEEYVGQLSMSLKKPFAKCSKEELLQIRLTVMNFSTIIDKLCRKLYEFIANELLGPLPQPSHIIAPYRSAGVEKSSELES